MEYAQMRDFSEFCEQLNEIRLRFHKWDSCERTVALYYLMVGLPFANARFLQHALEQAITAVNTPEAQTLERNANDPVFISNLLGERPQVALSLLLAHLPLLHPNNKDAADCYLMTIRRVLSEFITPPHKIYNECVEIMSYVFVHPAFDKEDKKSFNQLLRQVINRTGSNSFVQSPVNESSDESVSPNPEPTNYFTNSIGDTSRLNRRSNSLTPGQTSSHENLNVGAENWSSQENLSLPISKPRSYSLSNDKSLLVNVASIQSSSSETRLQDLQTLNNMPMMKGIVCWLKSLRLHKYSWVFNNLTYEQMLNLTEQNLESMGITKGARHKLLISIAKLKERSQTLKELETEVMNRGDLLTALKKLKTILQSPLQATSGEDLPSQFVKVIGKVCTQLLMLRQPSDECLVMFAALCERAETCDAFTTDQKRRLNLWRGQLSRGTHAVVHNHRTQASGNHKHLNVQSHYYMTPVLASFQQTYTQKSSSYPNVQNSPIVGAHRHSLGSTTLQNQLYTLNNHLPSTLKIYSHKNDQQGTLTNHTNGQQLHVHFKESEIGGDTRRKPILKSVDIESSLESLCLQMMEHALGP